jgi:tetratricopeptide (TPR) repeat protein
MVESADDAPDPQAALDAACDHAYEELRGGRYSAALEEAQTMLSTIPADASATPVSLVFALLLKAHALRELRDTSSAIAAYDQVIVSFPDDQRIDVERTVAIALSWKAKLLADGGELERADQTLDSLFTRLRSAKDGQLRAVLAQAYCDRGYRLERAGDLKGALSIYHAALQKFPTGERDDIDERVAWLARHHERLVRRLGVPLSGPPRMEAQ